MSITKLGMLGFLLSPGSGRLWLHGAVWVVRGVWARWEGLLVYDRKRRSHHLFLAPRTLRGRLTLFLRDYHLGSLGVFRSTWPWGRSQTFFRYHKLRPNTVFFYPWPLRPRPHRNVFVVCQPRRNRALLVRNYKLRPNRLFFKLRPLQFWLSRNIMMSRWRRGRWPSLFGRDHKLRLDSSFVALDLRFGVQRTPTQRFGPDQHFILGKGRTFLGGLTRGTFQRVGRSRQWRARCVRSRALYEGRIDG